MILIVKNRIRHYKRFRVDIWGLGNLCCDLRFKRYKRLALYFFSKYLDNLFYIREKHELSDYIYRIDLISPRSRMHYLPARFISLRLVKFFYLTLRYRQFYKLSRTAHKRDGFFEHHYCLALEGRIISFLYRTGFVSNMFDSLYYIKNCYVALNRKIVSYVNESVDLYEILSFHPMIKRLIYKDLIFRYIEMEYSLFSPPRYLYVSYWFLFSFMFKFPLQSDLALPRGIDIYRATGFAQ
jgi:hypothetical protein